ncbi:hypothetical protein JCM11641_005762 [Rhodosporidiobolus odoratus]
MIPLVWAGTLPAAWVAWRAEPKVWWEGATWIGENRKVILGLAAGFNFAIAPYTGIFVDPTTKRLRSMVDAGAGKQTRDRGKDDIELLQQWQKLYVPNVLLGLASMALLVVEMSAPVVDHPSLRVARATAVAALGFGAGVMATVPTLVLPALFSSTLSADQRLITWSRYYDRLSGFLRPFILVVSAILAGSAWNVTEPLVPKNFWCKNRKAILTLAAALNFAIAPYTAVFVNPLTYGKLKRIELELRKQEGDDSRAATAHEADVLLKKRWARAYIGKIILGLAALALAAGELAND